MYSPIEHIEEVEQVRMKFNLIQEEEVITSEEIDA
jgi:hypothetical protein